MWLPYMVAPRTVKMEGVRYGAVRLIYGENPNWWPSRARIRVVEQQEPPNGAISCREKTSTLTPQ
jgi:hypothetical protein